MIGSALKYVLQHPARALASIASEPLEAWTAVRERRVEHRQRPTPPDLYQADEDWEGQLHHSLGIRGQCAATSEFWKLWPEVIHEMGVKGIDAGPQSYKGWNDGDAGLVRAIWCLTRHLKPVNVVETGVAHGVTSRFILEALERNGVGHLWSIDHAPLEHIWRKQIGVAVGGRFPDRWTYISGSSTRRLPRLLSDLGQIDLFIHDSLHSEQNVRFELDRAWPALKAGGAIVVDDVDANWGFRTFVEAFPGHQFLVCEAEPLRPDLRRFNKKGLFGIVLKQPTASHAQN
jgi:Methyltransferase domain